MQRSGLRFGRRWSEGEQSPEGRHGGMVFATLGGMSMESVIVPGIGDRRTEAIFAQESCGVLRVLCNVGCSAGSA